MPKVAVAGAPVFVHGSVQAHELLPDDVPALQCFYERNPGYFLAVYGQPPAVDEAQQEFDDAPPAEMPFSRRWLLGFIEGEGSSGAWVGMASILSDFLAPRVWHIGLFIVDSSRHGSGFSPMIYQGLERWMVAGGAQWLRLGVVKGNTRAERFWERLGYVQVRERGPVEMGVRSNLLRVMVKPLCGGSITDFLALVTRDRPESAP